MPLTGPHLALPSDCRDLAICHASAFSSAGPRAVYNLIFSKCSPESMVKLETGILESSFEPHSRSKLVVMKDEDTGEIVSYAQWTLPLTTVEEQGTGVCSAEGKLERKPPEFPDGINLPLFKRMFFQTGDSEAEKESELLVSQENCWNLNRIGTEPEYQGKGAAMALLKWGTEQADRQGQFCILSTDPEQAAFQSYQKRGFKVIGKVSEIDLEPFGYSGILKNVRMIRHPQRI